MSDLCSVKVNGTLHQVAVGGTDTLLSTLRDRLRLRGSKRGCNQGVCGACTVLLDGRPARACLSLTANCEGVEITTIEALEKDGLGRRLQDAFARIGAVQCGFCTPGVLLTARALLEETPHPNVEEIREGISGNLCRCTGYRKIVDSIRSVAGGPA